MEDEELQRALQTSMHPTGGKRQSRKKGARRAVKDTINQKS